MLAGLLTLHDRLRIPESSDAVGTNVADTTADIPFEGVTEKLDGHVMVGGLASTTVNGKTHVLVLPA
jgi:hypothetical protein